MDAEQAQARLKELEAKAAKARLAEIEAKAPGDGTHAVLVAPGAGMLNGVHDAEGRLIAVPVEELIGLGADAAQTEVEQRKRGRAGSSGTRGKSQLQKFFEGANPSSRRCDAAGCPKTHRLSLGWVFVTVLKCKFS